MSENVSTCPPIINQHWMPELDFSQWAEVAQENGESFSEPIFQKREVTAVKEEAPGYVAITEAMRKFNEQQRHPEDPKPFIKSIFNSPHEIMERMKNSEGKTSKSRYKTMTYLQNLDRAGSSRDYTEQLLTPYKG